MNKLTPKQWMQIKTLLISGDRHAFGTHTRWHARRVEEPTRYEIIQFITIHILVNSSRLEQLISFLFGLTVRDTNSDESSNAMGYLNDYIEYFCSASFISAHTQFLISIAYNMGDSNLKVEQMKTKMKQSKHSNANETERRGNETIQFLYFMWFFYQSTAGNKNFNLTFILFHANTHTHKCSI